MLEVIGKDTLSEFLIPDLWKRKVSKEEVYEWLWYFKYYKFSVLRFLFWTSSDKFKIELEWNDPYPCNMDFGVFSNYENWEDLNSLYSQKADVGDLRDFGDKLSLILKGQPYYYQYLLDYFQESEYIHLLESKEDPFLVSSIRRVNGLVFPFFIKRIPKIEVGTLPLKITYLEWFKNHSYTRKNINSALTEIMYNTHRYLGPVPDLLLEKWRLLMIETLGWCSSHLDTGCIC